MRRVPAGGLAGEAVTLGEFVGEFEKPRYVAFEAGLCAHSRAKKTGCSNCIEVCATEAIRSKGDVIAVDPYLCKGCGTCSTVCPSGALSFQFPRVPELGQRVKTLLTEYARAGGPHHNAVCFGDATGRIRAAARLLGADYHELPC